MTQERKRTGWIVGILVLLVAGPFLASLAGLLPWSPINCWTYEVDLHTGHIRYTRYFAFLKVAQRVEESAVSRVLEPQDRQGSIADWRLVHTLSPNVHNSPHYSFHGAMSQMRTLEIGWRLGNFTPAARRASAKRVLQLWREGDEDDAAKSYQLALWEIGDRNSEAGRVTDVTDLPPEDPATALPEEKANPAR